MNRILPPQRIFETPRILMADAYTIGSEDFESPEAIEESVYYITFRNRLNKINSNLYEKGDNRIILYNFDYIVDKLFRKPYTHAEIDEAKEYLKTAKITMNGVKPYPFPEHLWRKVVDEFDGYLPLEIKAMPNGSVVYPNEPIVQVRPLVKGFGQLASWFESKLLQVWAPSERVTQSEHLLKYFKTVVKRVDPSLSQEMVHFFASNMITDFGDRAGINEEESEILGKAHLITFPGTDTFCGAYQAWKASNQTPQGFSVHALAHRNVQSHAVENDCYQIMYDKVENGEFASMVNDCNSSKVSVPFHVKLALHAKMTGNNKVVVSRADSGDAFTEIMRIINSAIEAGLYEEKVTETGTWKFAQNLHFLEGDGMEFKTIIEICEKLLNEGVAPYSWGLFGQGGGARNSIKRDNLSAKYALCAVKGRSVVKFSDTLGKTTLPGPFKVLRSKEALENRVTIVFEDEDGEDAMVKYYNGLDEQIFGTPLYETFPDVKKRVREQMDNMPLTLETEENHNFPASEKILDRRRELLVQYAPDKDIKNY